MWYVRVKMPFINLKIINLERALQLGSNIKKLASSQCLILYHTSNESISIPLIGNEIPIPCHAPYAIDRPTTFIPNGFRLGMGNPSEVNHGYLSHTSHNKNSTYPSSHWLRQDEGKEGIFS